MSIISGTVRRPVTMLIVTLLLAIFSWFTATKLSVGFLPDVEFPEVMVSTAYSEASPEEVESSITKPLEEVIRGIANLESISSQSRLGLSIINVEFKYGTGLDQNVSNLQERIDRIKDRLPSEANSPTVFRFSSNDVPVITLAITSNREINDMRQYVDSNLATYFEQTDGVASIEISGGNTKKVFVETSIDRLNAFNLTTSDIANAISANGQRSSLGYIETDSSDISLVINNKYENLEELNTLVVQEVPNGTGEPYHVRLQDIATIRFGYDTDNTISLFNNRPALQVYVFKLQDANIIDVSDRIRTTIQKVEGLSPHDFEFTIVDDNSIFIKDSIDAVAQAMMGGGILAVLILLFFLRNITSVLVIGISMPISVLLTLMFMYFAGLDINFMSLAGLALGIGMLVDNSVVVLEHIYKKRLRGVKLIPAAEFGTREMSRPILASTLTTVLVFFPLLVFRQELGNMGDFFAELAFTVVISVLASYCVATFVVPVLASKYLPLYRARYKSIFKLLNTGIEHILTAVISFYKKILTHILKKPKRYIALIISISFLPLILVPRLGFSFIPEFAPESFSVQMNFPSTMPLEEMYTYVKDFEARTDGIFEKVGVPMGNKSLNIIKTERSFNFFSRGNNTADYNIFYVSDINQQTHREILSEFSTYLNIYPGIIIQLRGERGGGGRNTGGSSDLELELKSNDYTKLQETAAHYVKLIEGNLGDKITNIEENLSTSTLEYEVNVNRTLANTYGVSIASLVNELQTAIQGRTANKYKQGADEYDIVLRLNAEDRAKTDLVEQLYINTARQTRVPIANVVDKQYSLSANEIRRKDFQRTITITGELVGEYSSAQAVADVRALLSTIPRDEDVNYIFRGEYEDIQENYIILLQVFLLALLFIYGIMASQFESFIDPFIIIFTVPLTFAGVVLIYFFTGNQISSFTIVGMVMLVGIAVNHGIVLVDYINLLRNRGHDLTQAIINTGGSRLQPILMTSFTTIFGLLPIVILNINGVALIKPLALTVVGGLSMSSMLSLFFIPLIYYQFHKKIAKTKAKRTLRQKIREEYTVEGGRDLEDI